MNADQPEDTLGAEPLDAVDVALLRALRAVCDVADPVPAGLVERLQFGLTLDALHAEIAALTETPFAVRFPSRVG